MKNKLIVDNELKKLENDLYIENLKKKENELSLRLDDLKKGKNDSLYVELLRKIMLKKNYLLGLLFLRKSIKESLGKVESNYYHYSKEEKIRLVTTLENNLKINREEIDKNHLEYRKLLEEKDRYALKIMKHKKELESILREVRKGAEEYTEEEFVKELIKIFRGNDFGKMYDSRNEDLGYSLGQIFIIKYALANLVRYLDNEDISLKMKSQIKLLKEYDFKNQGKSLGFKDFIKNLENGDVFNCRLESPELSYQGTLKLYKYISRSFRMPRVVASKMRRRLK